MGNSEQRSARPRSTLDMIDDLGTWQVQEAMPIERPKLVTMQVQHLRCADVWPEEILAQIRAIYAEADEGEGGLL